MNKPHLPQCFIVSVCENEKHKIELSCSKYCRFNWLFLYSSSYKETLYKCAFLSKMISCYSYWIILRSDYFVKIRYASWQMSKVRFNISVQCIFYNRDSVKGMMLDNTLQKLAKDYTIDDMTCSTPATTRTAFNTEQM